jgi:hypothetical protein
VVGQSISPPPIHITSNSHPPPIHLQSTSNHSMFHRPPIHLPSTSHPPPIHLPSVSHTPPIPLPSTYRVPVLATSSIHASIHPSGLTAISGTLRTCPWHMACDDHPGHVRQDHSHGRSAAVNVAASNSVPN